MASSPVLPLPGGYLARPAAFEDIQLLDAFLQRYERAVGVLPESHVGFFRWRWRQPYVDLARDTVVVEGEGEVVAFAVGDVEPGSEILNTAGRVDQRHLGRGLGSALLGWLDRSALARGVTTIRTLTPLEDAGGRRLLSSTGYREVRTVWDMGADLRGDEVAPDPPAGVRIRPFEPGEERLVYRVAVTAFRDHWDHEEDPSYEAFLGQWFGGDDPWRALMAERDGEVVGLLGWSDGADAYVFSVAVLQEHRRRGIGQALLRRAIADAAAAGHRHLYLSVDAENPTGAVRAYERAGLRVLRTTKIFDKDVGA